MPTPQLPTATPGVFEPPLVLRSVEAVHAYAVLSVRITQEVDGPPGGVLDLRGYDLHSAGSLADGHGVSVEFKDPSTLRDLRDVLDAAIRQAERDGLLGKAPAVPPAPAHAPPPEALLMKPIFHMAGMEGSLAPGVHLSRTPNGAVELRCVTADGRVLGTMQVANECYTDQTLTLAWLWLTDHDAAAAAAVGWTEPAPAPAATAPALTVAAGGNKPSRGRPRTRRPLGLVRGDLAAPARPGAARHPRPDGGAA